LGAAAPAAARAPGAANVIGDGIEIDDSGAPDGTNNNAIEGNFIGTDPTGTYNFGRAIGILLEGNAVSQGLADNMVSGNVIDNESLVGVEIYGIAAKGNVVAGNFIGTDPTGTQAHGNGVGVEVAGGAHNNTIGGTAPGAGNVIAHNTGTGVVIGSSITDTDTVGNTVRGNSIHDNGGLGIDLGNDGVTLNHNHNPAPGPNNLQNFPELTRARSLSHGRTEVAGRLHSAPNTTYTLDVYASAHANPSGYGEGQVYLGSVTITTNANGNAFFDVLLSAATTSGQVVSATATDRGGDTSEFSAVQTVHP
jgi:titin